MVLRILCCIVFLTHEIQCWQMYHTPTMRKMTTTKENMRLKNDDQRCGGFLQIKSSGSWHYVCDSTFTAQNAFVTCRDFDCGFPYVYAPSPSFFEVYTWSGAFNCSGQEQHLADCPVAPLESDSGCRPTAVECTDQPKDPKVNIYSLKGSEHSADNLVYAGNSYVIMCRIDTPLKVRSFVLRVEDADSSEWSQPAVDNAAYFFLPYRNNDFSFSCQYNFEMNPETFSHPRSGHVHFREPSNVRLVGGESRCVGRLELEHEGEWRAVSQQLWSLNEAAVVCRQLNCGSAIRTSTQSQSRELQPVWRFFSDCDGSEKALLGCGSIMEGQSVSTVSVLCSDILHPPNISAAAQKNSSEVDSLVVYSPYSFYINCSVLPQFPGGHFSLVFTGVKHSLTLNQTAVNHSAVFTFDLAEKAHSGNYSCIYHNTVSGHNFSSQSPQLVIVVEDAEDVLLDDGGARHFNRTVCSGTLLVKDRFKTMMVTAETRHWDMRHASIVCRQLGCGSALSTSETQVPNVTSMWRFFSDCDGSEAALLQCGRVKKWFSSKAIVVICEG